MTKKRLLVIAGLLAFIACATLAVLAMLPPRPCVTKANFDRIQNGMAMEEVDALLGKSDLLPADFGITIMLDGLPVSHLVWLGDDGQAHIGFAASRVYEKAWTDNPRSWSDKIRRWLHLP